MSYQTDKPRENHARVVRALELCSDIYRDIILSQIAPEDLKCRAEGRTQFYESLSRDEKQKIKNASMTKTLENLDISIMYKILRHVCIIPAPKSGWGGSTLPGSDFELADDIERIRLIRNEAVGHSPKSQIDDAKLNIFWKELSLVVERMDRRNLKHYGGPLEEIRHCSMNAQVETIKRITKDVQCLFNNIFHCRIDRIADEIQRRLGENNCIILTGIGGCGKTSVAKQAVKELSTSISTKDIFFVNTVEEFSSVVGLGDLQVILIDDPFGKSNWNKTELDSWQRYFSKMEALVQSKKCFLLLTCRKSIFESVKGSTDKCKIFDKKNIMDLSTEWNFTIAEKKHFLYESVRYFEYEVHDSSATWPSEEKRRIKSSLIDSISKTVPRMGFPQACHLFFSKLDFFKQGVDFFVKADESLVVEINSIRVRSPDDYAILVYILLQSNHEIDTKGRYKMELIEKICQLLEIMTLSPVKLHDKVKITLSSLYLQKKGSASHIYTFQHESILESVLKSFCQFFAKEFLEMAPIETIRHFIRPSFHQTQPGEICYLLSPDLDSNLVCLYGESIIEEKAPIDDLWIICEFWEEHLQSLLNSLNERGIDYLYRKTKNVGKRFRLCNDAIRKHLSSEKAHVLLTVILTMFPNVLFEYISLDTLIYENTPNKAICRTILDCTFSSVMLQYKDLSNKTCMTGLVRLLWCMSDSDFKDVTSEVIKGMDNLITEIRRLSCQKTEILFWSVVIKEFCYKCDDQIDMYEILIERACIFLSAGELMRLGEVELWDCLDSDIKKQRTVVGKRILKFLRSIPETAMQEWIMTEKLTSAVFVYILEHMLNLATETMTKNISCESCSDLMNDDAFVNLSKICKRLPNVITFRTLNSAVTLGATELLRLFLFYECITDIQLQAVLEWQESDGDDNSLREILGKDDCMVIFGSMKKNPQIITHETVQVAMEIGAINSLKVILFCANEADSQHSVLQKIIESEMFRKFDRQVKVLKKMFERDEFDLSRMINTHKKDNVLLVRQELSKTCQKDIQICWNKFLDKEDPEIMSLIVKELPHLITFKTVQTAISNGALTSLKYILTSAKVTGNKYLEMNGYDKTLKGNPLVCWKDSFEENSLMDWLMFFEKDEDEIMNLLVRKFPQILTPTTIRAAIGIGAVSPLKVLLKTEKVMNTIHRKWEEVAYKSSFSKDDNEIRKFFMKFPRRIEKETGIKVIEAGAVNSDIVILTTQKIGQHIMKANFTGNKCSSIYWNQLLEKDDVEIMNLLIKKLPQIISDETVEAAIETSAVNSLKVILTSEILRDNIWERTPFRMEHRKKSFREYSLIDWSRFLEKDEVEIMILLLKEISEIITFRTIQASIGVGAIRSLKVILSSEKVMDAISQQRKKSALFANTYGEKTRLLITEFPQRITEKTRQEVIEVDVFNPLQILYTTREEMYIDHAKMEIGNRKREKSYPIYWKKLLEKDDVEIMNLLIKKLPQIISDETVEAVIETSAVNTLKVILIAEKETQNYHSVMKAIRKSLEKDSLSHWNKLLQKDDVEILQMLLREMPEIITHRTVQAAKETGAVNSLRLLLATEKETNDHKNMEVIRKTGGKNSMVYCSIL